MVVKVTKELNMQ